MKKELIILILGAACVSTPALSDPESLPATIASQRADAFRLPPENIAVQQDVDRIFWMTTDDLKIQLEQYPGVFAGTDRVRKRPVVKAPPPAPLVEVIRPARSAPQPTPVAQQSASTPQNTPPARTSIPAEEPAARSSSWSSQIATQAPAPVEEGRVRQIIPAQPPTASVDRPTPSIKQSTAVSAQNGAVTDGSGRTTVTLSPDTVISPPNVPGGGYVPFK